MSMHEVEQFVSGMTALMFAKFIMNDVPHALGLMGKKINAYTEYKMRCPHREPDGWECRYEYKVQLIEELHEDRWERCPLCGYGAPFVEFVKKE